MPALKSLSQKIVVSMILLSVVLSACQPKPGGQETPTPFFLSTPIPGLCDIKFPPDFEPEPGHLVACWLYQ